ncbi:MAG: exodeoxyribonuclease VII large subunit [Candidatus Aenigmarchaeota archaeon]|nr:exodeoxyribonuclease VII large subunit [Candidatus Aenigmarchaeota archaeon]
MNERNVTRISLVGSFTCIIILYIFTIVNFTPHVNISDIDKTFIGKSVNTSGEISGLYANNGNVFFMIVDGKNEIKIVIWQDTLKMLSAKGQNISEIKNGNYVNIVGSVELYKGELEIIPTHDNVNIIKK